MNGRGEYTFADGSVLSGTFADNRFDSGEYTVTGEKYTLKRTVADGKLNDKVSIELASGDSFYGTVSDGKFSGTGTVNYGNGDKYSGSFSASKRNGDGTYTWDDGARYSGAWSKDKMSGKGTYYYSEDDYPRLDGEFDNGVPDGTCTYYETADVKYRTTWSDGECTKVEEK